MRLIVVLLLITTASQAQPVMIRFVIGSELATTMTEVTGEHIDTEAGPYYFKDVQRLTFQMNLPDSAALEKLTSHGIEIYLRSKRVTPLIIRKTAPPPPPQKSPGDTSNAATKERPANKPPPTREAIPEREYSASSAGGFGLGLDYGGIGLKLTLNPTDVVSFFGGLGYNLNKIGYNAGLEFNFTPKERTTPFLSAMYGYNAVLIYPGAPASQNRTFYGPSFGLGVKSRSRRNEDFFCIQIIYPIRDSAFLNAPLTEKPWPVLFSVGYHFGK